MMLPPPMPNRPARMPVTMPPATIPRRGRQLADGDAADHQAAMCARSPGESTTSASASVEHRGAGAGLDRLGRQVAAERARAGHAAEQAQHVAGDAGKLRAAGKLALDIRQHRLRRRLGMRERRRLAEDQRIDREQPPRLLIGGAAHHHAVDAVEERRSPARRVATPPLSTTGSCGCAAFSRNTRS